MPTPHYPTAAVRRALRKLGADIHDARRRRRLPMSVIAELASPLPRGVSPPPREQPIFGSIGDEAPDTWGRRLMQRDERRRAERDGRPVRTLHEVDYLLGVSDETRLGALRFRLAGDDVF